VFRVPLGRARRIASLDLRGLAQRQFGVAAAAEGAGQLIDGGGDVAHTAAAVAVLPHLLVIEELLGLVGADTQESRCLLERVVLKHVSTRSRPARRGSKGSCESARPGGGSAHRTPAAYFNIIDCNAAGTLAKWR